MVCELFETNVNKPKTKFVKNLNSMSLLNNTRVLVRAEQHLGPITHFIFVFAPHHWLHIHHWLKRTGWIHKSDFAMPHALNLHYGITVSSIVAYSWKSAFWKTLKLCTEIKQRYRWCSTILSSMHHWQSTDREKGELSSGKAITLKNTGRNESDVNSRVGNEQSSQPIRVFALTCTPVVMENWGQVESQCAALECWWEAGVFRESAEEIIANRPTRPGEKWTLAPTHSDRIYLLVKYCQGL